MGKHITRLKPKPATRMADGGKYGDLVLELRDSSVTIRPARRWKESAVTVTWDQVYILALANALDADAVQFSKTTRRRRKKAAKLADAIVNGGTT
jgi:hypothetical protein